MPALTGHSFKFSGMVAKKKKPDKVLTHMELALSSARGTAATNKKALGNDKSYENQTGQRGRA